MARANLSVTEELTTTFLEAQGGHVRAVVVGIDGESIEFRSTIPSVGSSAEDFNALQTNLPTEDACFVLFCTTVQEVQGESTPSGAADYRWILVVYVPETAKVKHKMLFSSSREDLKRQLGFSYFLGEIYFNELSEVTWDNYLESRKQEKREDMVLSEAEKLLKNEATLERDMSSTSHGMGVIPFAMTAPLVDGIKKLLAGDCNWVEIMVDLEKESLNCVGTSAYSLDDGEKLENAVSENEPRFIIFDVPKGDIRIKFLVYSCPETAKIKAKMMYSTAKATLIASMEAEGLKIEKFVEITARKELKSYVEFELVDKSAVQQQTIFNRPPPPRRGGRTKGRGGRGRATAK